MRDATIPQIDKGCFLNHAAISPIPPIVADAAIEALKNLTTGSPDIDNWVLAMEKSRRKVASLINTTSSSIGFLQNTSQAISTIAEGISWNKGDEVLIPDFEYPANQYPWLNLESKGVQIKRAPSTNGKVDIHWLKKNMSPTTKLVAFSYIQYSNGYRANVKELAAYCKTHNILTLVDAIQGFGAFPVDVQEWNIDFCAFGSQKWLMAPPGISVLYIREHLIEQIRPSMTGAFSVVNPFDTNTIDLTFPKEANKIESGTMNFTLFPAFLKALELLEERDVENISKRVLSHGRLLNNLITEKGYTVTSPSNTNEMSGIITFTHNRETIEEAYKRLCKAGVITTLRDKTIRFSPHFYNTEQQLKEVVKLL